MSAKEPTVSRSTSYAVDPTLYLYTSLTAGSSHIITATSTLETILHGNRLDFESVDTATDEKARTLWRRRAGGKKLPGLVKYGTVIGNIDDIETWNEEEVLVDKIQNVPGRKPLEEKMEIFESNTSVKPSSIKASLKHVKSDKPAPAPTEQPLSKKEHRRVLSDAEFEDLLNAAKAEHPDQETIDALLYESQRRQSLANPTESPKPSEKPIEETISHSAAPTKEPSNSMNEPNGVPNVKVGEEMEAPTTEKPKYKEVSDEEIARAQIAQAKNIAAASEAAAKKAKEQNHAKLVAAAGRSVASPTETKPGPQDAEVVAAPVSGEKKEDAVKQPGNSDRAEEDKKQEQRSKEEKEAEFIPQKGDITQRASVDVGLLNTAQSPQAKSQRIEYAAASAAARENKSKSAIFGGMGASKPQDTPIFEPNNKAIAEEPSEPEKMDEINRYSTQAPEAEQLFSDTKHEVNDRESEDVAARNSLPVVEPKGTQQPTPHVKEIDSVRGVANDEKPKPETLPAPEVQSSSPEVESKKQDGPEENPIVTPTTNAAPVQDQQVMQENVVPAATNVQAEVAKQAQSPMTAIEEKPNSPDISFLPEVSVETSFLGQPAGGDDEQDIPLDELIRNYNLAAEMHDESLAAEAPEESAVVPSNISSEEPEVKPEVKPEIEPEVKPEVKPEVMPEAEPVAEPAEQAVEKAPVQEQQQERQSMPQRKNTTKSDKLPSELFTSSELNLDFNFDLDKSSASDAVEKDKELPLPAEIQRPPSGASSQRPYSSLFDSISEKDKDAGSSGRGFTSRHKHTRTASSKLSAFGLGESRTAKRRNKELAGDEGESSLAVDAEGSRSLSLDVPSQSQRSQSQYSVPTDKEAQAAPASEENPATSAGIDFFSSTPTAPATSAGIDFFASNSTAPATAPQTVTPKVVVSSNGPSDDGPVDFSDVQDLDLSLNLPATPSITPRPATSTGVSPDAVSSGHSIASAEGSTSRKPSKRRQASRSFSVEPARSVKEKGKKAVEGKKNAKKDGKSTCFCM